MIRIKKLASMPTRPKLKNFFRSEPKCIVHGAGSRCELSAIHGTPKVPSSIKKAEYVFEKTGIVVTAKGMNILRNAINNHLVKSYAKNKGKEKALVAFKNGFLQGQRTMLSPFTPKGIKQTEKYIKQFKKNIKNPKKFFDGKL